MMEINDEIKKVKRILIASSGFTILIIGLALLFLPGPGILIILIGLALLATQFLWAKRLLDRIRKTAVKLK